MLDTANRDPSTMATLTPPLLGTSGAALGDSVTVQDTDGAEEDEEADSSTVGGGGAPSTIESLRNPWAPAGALSLSMVVSQATGSPVSAKTNLLLARRFSIALSNHRTYKRRSLRVLCVSLESGGGSINFSLSLLTTRSALKIGPMWGQCSKQLRVHSCFSSSGAAQQKPPIGNMGRY